MAEPDYELITLIKRLSALMYQHIDMLLKPYDLARSQYVVLKHLRERGGLATSELLAKLRVEPATLSGLVDALEAKGLVRRVERLEDKRRKDVRLTPTGRKLLDEVPPLAPEVERILLADVNPRAAATFRLVGWHMVRNLECELKEGE